MTSEPGSASQRPRPEDAHAGVEAAATEGFNNDEDDEDFEDDLEDGETADGEPDPEARHGWPLGTLLATAAGVWVGRWFDRLPDGVEQLAGLLLTLATAIFAAGLYRRWVRRQFAEARARRRR